MLLQEKDAADNIEEGRKADRVMTPPDEEQAMGSQPFMAFMQVQKEDAQMTSNVPVVPPMKKRQQSREA
ncbi:hypothetical protein WJX73_006363 [Symbiochloris irregularis]|uniref:Uncharacterized protein n=1 Tax=Symbiochloris irregularis TaxID=706552 RepID=A0AAW1PNX2_9CHLO